MSNYGFFKTKNKRVFLGRVSLSPCAFALAINILALLALAAIGFGIGMIFSTNSNRLYGEHCYWDSDCVKSMNMVCSNNKICECPSTAYYKSLSTGCGKLLKEISILFY